MHPNRSNRRAAVAGVLALLVTVALSWATPASADDSSDKSRIDRDLARTQSTLEAATAQAQAAAAQYLQANAQLPAAQNLLADAKGKVAAAEVASRQADRDSAAAAAAAATANRQYDAAAARVEAARRQVSQFVSQTYQGSGFLEINSILESGSPSQFADNLGYLDQIAASQRKAVNALTVARMDAKVRANAALAAQQKADDARDRARAALASSQDAAAAAQKATDDVQSLVSQRQKAKAVADQQRGAVLAQYNELKAESDRIAAELRDAASKVGVAPVNAPAGGKGFFLMPTQGWKSSDFGMRFDPYYKVWQLHAGVDIAAPTGQGIYAAADGRVMFTGWSGGYGNYTCISHGMYQGSDLSTCYGHQSEILVQQGQRVRRGQLIGLVGSTGAATGSHLHFEVRRGGTPVQPLPWLPACFC